VLLVTKENVLFQLTIRNKDGRIVSSYEKDKLVPGAYSLCFCGVTALGKRILCITLIYIRSIIELALLHY
jgi:hypothetical protein